MLGGGFGKGFRQPGPGLLQGPVGRLDPAASQISLCPFLDDAILNDRLERKIALK
jgi:hypothetical protein